MRIRVLTTLPEMFPAVLGAGVLGRAAERGLLDLAVINLRDFTTDRHRTTDDYPYGGGAGMVMKAEPIATALDDLRAADPTVHVVLTTPQGRPFDQSVARELVTHESVAFLCGRYEGVDERVRSLVDTELSLGDFVLSGGEIAALAMIDAVSRLVPGVLGNEASTTEESFTTPLLEYPQYTRPRVFRGQTVPEVLISGDHAAIAAYRQREALRRTRARRPDLYAAAAGSAGDDSPAR